MTYFSLRKREIEPEPEPIEEATEEAEDQPEPEESAAPEPTGILAGVRGWFAWSTALIGATWAYSIHAIAVWACFYYGGWLLIGIPLAFLLAVAAFTPREHIDRLTAWIERHDSAPWAPLTGAGETTPADPRRHVAQWLLNTIGNRPGIHLRELYPAMRELPGQEGRTDAELRARLKALGVPVSRSVRIGRISGRSGVYRHHVEALLPSAGERPVESDVDAGQGADSPPLSEVGEGV